MTVQMAAARKNCVWYGRSRGHVTIATGRLQSPTVVVGRQSDT